MTAPKAISLDQLIALNDEMAALTRAGVPLERGLIDLGRDLSGRLGRLTTALGQRMEAGESLSQALASADPAFPPLYRAVVSAGLRSGRLTAALEGIAMTSRRVAQLRRIVAAALIYPLVLLAVLYGLFLFSLTKTLPVVLDPYQSEPLTGVWIEMLRWLSQTVVWWAPWPPLIFGLSLGVWWYRGGRATSAVWVTGRLPSFRQLRNAGRLATFAEVLALLVDQQVPLDEAVALAGEASGDRRLATSARQLAVEIQGGQSLAGVPAGFPPLLGWLLAAGHRPPDLSAALRRAAQGYREQAQRAADWLTVYLPIVLAAGLGGIATLIYAVIVLGPWFQLLYEWS